MTEGRRLQLDVVVDYTYALDTFYRCDYHVLKIEVTTCKEVLSNLCGIGLCSSVEETVAMLLYLVIKNHSFSDGDKRVTTTLFLWFLNGILYNEDGSKRIANNTLLLLPL